MTVLRVASCNIRHALHVNAFGDDVAQVLGVDGLDLAGFQECSGADRRATLVTVTDAAGHGLVNLDPYQTPVTHRLDRWELVESFRWHLTRRKKVGPAGAGPLFMSAKWAVVQVVRDVTTGTIVAHANCHLVPSIFLPIRRRLHRRQIQRLAALVADLRGEYPAAVVLVGGDFNATLTTPAGWEKPLRDAGLTYGGSTKPTHGNRAIDHIFSTVPMTSHYTINDLRTDHRAVVCDFELDDEGEIVPSDPTVAQRGTDTSGRPILASDLMWAWWEARCYDLGFVPTITQGSWMSKVPGGGAAASAGYHDYGGCFDLRVWDRTDAEVDAMIANFRANGAAAWLRNIVHGGFTDAHIHLVLRADNALSSGAAWQWIEYLNDLDGLASRGPDYHPRPSPLVRVPPKGSLMPTAKEIAAEVAPAVWAEALKTGDGADMRARVMLAQIHKRTGDTRTLAKALKDAGLPVDEATIEAAIRKVFGALDEAQP